ncbi:hypothetical protein NB693_21220 [Pantoea ananatis]|uniref:hypothetical protein n=1 Tax=Pantoea ananas TaxID=553 RepID=UPI00221F6F04|nr:hypothetical protein [Pantoea ananatis]
MARSVVLNRYALTIARSLSGAGIDQDGISQPVASATDLLASTQAFALCFQACVAEAVAEECAVAHSCLCQRLLCNPGAVQGRGQLS